MLQWCWQSFIWDSESFYSSLHVVSILIQASAPHPQHRSLVAAFILFYFIFLLLRGNYFTFMSMRILLGVCSAADLCRSSAAQLFMLPFKGDDQSSRWGAGSAPNQGGSKWMWTGAQENFLFFLQSDQSVRKNQAGKQLVCSLCAMGSSGWWRWQKLVMRGLTALLCPRIPETFCAGNERGKENAGVWV